MALYDGWGNVANSARSTGNYMNSLYKDAYKRLGDALIDDLETYGGQLWDWNQDRIRGNKLLEAYKNRYYDVVEGEDGEKSLVAKKGPSLSDFEGGRYAAYADDPTMLQLMDSYNTSGATLDEVEAAKEGLSRKEFLEYIQSLQGQDNTRRNAASKSMAERASMLGEKRSAEEREDEKWLRDSRLSYALKSLGDAQQNYMQSMITAPTGTFHQASLEEGRRKSLDDTETARNAIRELLHLYGYYQDGKEGSEGEEKGTEAPGTEGSEGEEEQTAAQEFIEFYKMLTNDKMGPLTENGYDWVAEELKKAVSRDVVIGKDEWNKIGEVLENSDLKSKVLKKSPLIAKQFKSLVDKRASEERKAIQEKRTQNANELDSKLMRGKMPTDDDRKLFPTKEDKEWLRGYNSALYYRLFPSKGAK